MKSLFEVARNHQDMFRRLAPAFIVLLMSLPEGGLPMPIPWSSRGRTLDPSMIPVVIIPGTGGNQIEARLNKTTVVADFCEKTRDWYMIWLNIWDKVVAGRMDCFVDNFKLHYDPVTKAFSNQPGVEIRVPGWGNTNSIDYIDTSWIAWFFGVAQYMHPLVSNMVSWGYVRGTSVRGAPYDPRFAPHSQSDYFKRLTELIEDTYFINGNRKVALLAHSMGGLFGLYFLNKQPQEWKDRYIRVYIPTSTPWDGTAMMHQVFASGTNWGVDIVDPFILREQQRAQESVGMLFARPGPWRADMTIVRTPVKTYSAFDNQQFMTDIEFSMGLDILNHFNSSDYEQKHPGVDIQCIFSDGVETPEKFIYQEHFYDGVKGEPFRTVYGPGDGTVNLRSLRGCRKMRGNGSKKVELHRIYDASHNGILSNSQYYETIKRLLIIYSHFDD